MWWGTCLWFSLYAFGFFRESQSFPCRGWEFYRFDSHTVFFPFLLLEEFSAMLLGQQFPSGELYTDENWALPASLPTLGPGRHDAKCDTCESIALAALTPGSECTHSHPHTLSRPASCWCLSHAWGLRVLTEDCPLILHLCHFHGRLLSIPARDS